MGEGLMGEGLIARVCVDSPLPHLDRLFDYTVPQALASVVDVGTRVRAPFHGRLVSGIVCELGGDADYTGRIQEVHSAGLVPSTTRAGIDLARSVAHRYGGSLWDVLRLAVPPRVAAVEKRWAGRGVGPAPEIVEKRWVGRGLGPAPETVERIGRAVAGQVLDPRLTSGERIVWEAVPDPDRSSLPMSTIAALALEAAQSSSVIVVVPDARAIWALAGRLKELGLLRWTSRSCGDFAIIHTKDGPAVRYENYLAALHGATPIVLGTRSSVFQPVPSLGLLMVWAEGHSAYQDPHAPYPHARTVAALRTEAERSRLILGGWAPSVEAAALVEHGWADLLAPPRDAVREAVPAIEVLTGDRRSREGPRGWHWMPEAAWRVLTGGLSTGPVFILVPRAGYVTAFACARCGEWALCPACEGPLSMGRRGDPPTCGGCGAERPHWHCPECHSDRLSESRQGVERIGEQVRRMAPGVRVDISSAATGIIEDLVFQKVIKDGTFRKQFVVATPGALPAVEGGYAAGVIVGADSGLGRAGTEVDAAGLWFGAAALVRSRNSGGRVVVVGDVEPSVRRALETWTPGEFARGAARERAALGLPPFGRVIKVEASETLLEEALSLVVDGEAIGSHAEVAVVPSKPGTRTLLCGRRVAQEVVDSLRDLQRESSAGGRELRLRVDGPLASSD